MSTKKIALYGLLMALAMIFSYVESLLPVFVAVPGVKLGLPNIVILFTLYCLDIKSAAIVSLVRVVLAGFMFGNLFAIIYGLAGAILSLIVIYILYKSGKFSPVGVSVAGGVAHNTGQILVAVAVTETSRLIYYLPVLCIAGITAGACIGIVSGIVIQKLESKAEKY